MILLYEELDLLLPNDSEFLITVTNYSLIVDYDLSGYTGDDVTHSATPPIATRAVSFIEALGIHTIIIAIIAVAAVLIITGHVVLTCRKRCRQQTWSVQSASNTARGRFQRDAWSGIRRLDSSQQSAGNDPFHTDIYRTLAYAYINWKQDMTSIPGSSRSFSSASGSSEKHVGILSGHAADSVTPCSSRTADDVTLPSSLTGDISLTSSMTWRQQTPSSCTKESDISRSDVTGELSVSNYGKEHSQKTDLSFAVKFTNFDGEYDVRVQSVLGSEAVVDLDSSVGVPSDDGHSDITVNSISSGRNSSPISLHIGIDDSLTDVTI